MQEEWLKDHPEAAKRMEEMKARQEARKAEILKKYDKDGDGKLSDEEKKAMREDWAKNHPEAAKRMEEMKARQEAHAAAMIKNLTKTATGSSPRKNCSPFPLITASPARTMPFPVAPKDRECPTWTVRGVREAPELKAPRSQRTGRPQRR